MSRRRERLPRAYEPSTESLRAAASIPSPPPRDEADPRTCPRCGSGLVYPQAWAERSRERWRIDLRCPECEWRGRGVFGQRVAERFDEDLERGTDALVHDLELLARANMTEDVERFAHALAVGAVQPMDF
jgi:hypothetical protein